MRTESVGTVIQHNRRTGAARLRVAAPRLRRPLELRHRAFAETWAAVVTRLESWRTGLKTINDTAVICALFVSAGVIYSPTVEGFILNLCWCAAHIPDGPDSSPIEALHRYSSCGLVFVI